MRALCGPFSQVNHKLLYEQLVGMTSREDKNCEGYCCVRRDELSWREPPDLLISSRRFQRFHFLAVLEHFREVVLLEDCIAQSNEIMLYNGNFLAVLLVNDGKEQLELLFLQLWGTSEHDGNGEICGRTGRCFRTTRQDYSGADHTQCTWKAQSALRSGPLHLQFQFLPQHDENGSVNHVFSMEEVHSSARNSPFSGQAPHSSASMHSGRELCSSVAVPSLSAEVVTRFTPGTGGRRERLHRRSSTEQVGRRSCVQVAPDRSPRKHMPDAVVLPLHWPGWLMPCSSPMRPERHGGTGSGAGTRPRIRRGESRKCSAEFRQLWQ